MTLYFVDVARWLIEDRKVTAVELVVRVLRYREP
jgi:hypothetical protein